jgi:hypothetical protein
MYDSSKASPTGPTLSQQVRNEPACVPATEGMEPGVVRVQAVRLNPEIGMVVVEEDNLAFKGGKADAVEWAEGSSPFLRYGKQEGTPPGSKDGACTHGVARELGRACCLPATNRRSLRAAG